MPPVARKVATPGSRPQHPAISPGRGRPKKIQKKSSSRKDNYRTKYVKADFLKAVKAIETKKMTLGEAARHYGVPKTTLHDRLNAKAGEKLGRPTELTEEEEKIIVERLVLMGEWGFPLTCRDLTAIIKAYLDELGRTTRNVRKL
jgi:transposase-like protein